MLYSLCDGQNFNSKTTKGYHPIQTVSKFKLLLYPIATSPAPPTEPGKTHRMYYMNNGIHYFLLKLIWIQDILQSVYMWTGLHKNHWYTLTYTTKATYKAVLVVNTIVLILMGSDSILYKILTSGNVNTFVVPSRACQNGRRSCDCCYTMFCQFYWFFANKFSEAFFGFIIYYMF